jgi:hypothetical protein
MDSILVKIQKLIAHQKSAEEMGSIHEAEAFALKIQKLANKHNISLNNIPMEELKENVTREFFSTKVKSVSDILGYFVIRPIAKANYCQAILGQKATMVIVGSRENIDITKSIYDIVLPIFVKEGKRLYNLGSKSVGLDTHLREFLRGCAEGLGIKFKEAAALLLKAEAGTALVVVRNNEAVKHYVETRMKITFKKQSKFTKTGAYHDGVRTGKNVQINKNLE